jgi:hypothetical protein
MIGHVRGPGGAVETVPRPQSGSATASSRSPADRPFWDSLRDEMGASETRDGGTTPSAARGVTSDREPPESVDGSVSAPESSPSGVVLPWSPSAARIVTEAGVTAGPMPSSDVPISVVAPVAASLGQVPTEGGQEPGQEVSWVAVGSESMGESGRIPVSSDPVPQEQKPRVDPQTAEHKAGQGSRPPMRSQSRPFPESGGLQGGAGLAAGTGEPGQRVGAPSVDLGPRFGTTGRNHVSETAAAGDPTAVLGWAAGRLGRAPDPSVSRIEAWVRENLTGPVPPSGSMAGAGFHGATGLDSGVSLRWRPVADAGVRWLLEVRVDPSIRVASPDEWNRLGETLSTLGVRLQVAASDAPRDTRSGEGSQNWHPSRYQGSPDSKSDLPHRNKSHGGNEMPWGGEGPENDAVKGSKAGGTRRFRVG